jgi:hypothetical protein
MEDQRIVMLKAEIELHKICIASNEKLIADIAKYKTLRIPGSTPEPYGHLELLWGETTSYCEHDTNRHLKRIGHIEAELLYRRRNG